MSFFFRLFGFVARKQGSTTDNVSHLFAELEAEQPASAIVGFVSRMMKRWKPRDGHLGNSSSPCPSHWETRSYFLKQTLLFVPSLFALLVCLEFIQRGRIQCGIDVGTRGSAFGDVRKNGGLFVGAKDDKGTEERGEELQVFMLFVSTDLTKGSCNTKCKNGVALKPLLFSFF